MTDNYPKRTLGQRYQGTDIPALLTERTDLAPEYIRVMVRTNTNGTTPIRIQRLMISNWKR